MPRAKPARYVPSSGFGYPLDGLLPRIPCRFCFTPAALMGFSLRRFPLPQGSTAFQPGKTCTPLAQRYLRRTKRQTGPTSLGFQVYACQDCLATARHFKPTATGASLGFCPSRVVTAKTLPRTSPELLSRAWPPLTVTQRTGPHLRVSIDLRRALPDQHRSAKPAKATLVGFLHLPAPDHSSLTRARAMEFTSRRVMHCC